MNMLKRNFLYFMLIFLLSCEADIDSRIMKGEPIKEVVISADDLIVSTESRTTFEMIDGEAIFKWVLNDTIGIFPSSGGYQVAFPLENFVSNDASKAVFTGGGWALISGENYRAYYPFAYNNRSAEIIPITYLGQIQEGNNSLEHLGAYDYMYTNGAGAVDGSVNFAFKHIGTLLRLYVTLPEAMELTSVELISSVDETFVDKGSYDLTKDSPTIEKPQKSNTITLGLDEVSGSENEVITLYVWTAPFQLLGDLTIKVFGKDKWYSQTFSNVELNWVAQTVNNITLQRLVYGGEIAEGTKVINEETLKAALSTSSTDDTPIVIDGDIVLTEPLNISASTTIDLNGNSLNVGENTINVEAGESLNLINTSNAYTRSTVEVTNSITGSGDIIKAAENSTITIGEGVNLTTTGAEMCCVFVPVGAENVTINTQGNLLATQAGAATIYVNGNVKSGTINVKGGSVKHEQDVAIYIAGKADLNISGGEIEGTTGVEMRAGNLNVTGGTITATAEEFVATPNGNGSTSVGAAIAVTQHSTNYELNATISGGTFTGVRALYEEDTCDDNISGISMSVNGGTFNGEVYSENVSNFIINGTFHKFIPANYAANNTMVAVSGSDDAKVYEVIDLSNGYTMTSDIEIATPITINTTGSINFNLGSYSLTNKTAYDYDNCGQTECYVFEVQSGILNISGEGSVNAIGGSDYDMAVFANGTGQVNISGGKFTNEGKENDGCDLIYVRDQAAVAISGGEFAAGNQSSDVGNQYVALNLRDANRSTASITVTGGKFHKFNPANNVSEGSLTNFAANNTMVAVSGSDDAKVYEVIDLSNGYTMTSDIEIATPITINTTGSINFNLGSYSLTNKTAYDYDNCGQTECYVFEVQSGILNISGEGSVNAIGGSDYDMAVFANGTGQVNISGGKFTNEGKENDGCDLIYVRDQAAVAISGGEFAAGNQSSDVGNQFVALNLRDANRSTASITVTGGKFYKFDPANNVSEGANTNFVADGYSSYEDGDYYKVSATSEGTAVAEALSVVNL